MRSHREIVKTAGASELVRLLNARGLEMHKSTPQRWADRDSIPGEYWQPLADLGVATLEELAAAKSLIGANTDANVEAAA